MGGIKFKVHPLFILLGAYYALTGRAVVFVLYTLSALSHELGHSIVAGNLGYSLNRVTLMPFGAVVRGDISGLKCMDQLKIALAGPLVNLAVGLATVASWWLFPVLYAFTDILAEANLSLFLINLLPVFPLDGGRVMQSLLSLKFKRKTADIVCKIIGGSLAILLFGAFVFTLFGTPNFSLLFFSAFALVGAFGKSAKENEYTRVITGVKGNTLKRGMPVKRQAVDKSVTLKRLIRLLDAQSVNELLVYADGKLLVTLEQERLTDILQKGDLYSPLSRYI